LPRGPVRNVIIILLIFILFHHNPSFTVPGPKHIVHHESIFNQVEVKSPPIRVVFVVYAQRAWTTHESLWVLVGFGHFEKRLHASNVLRGSSVGVHPLPIHLHHIKSTSYIKKSTKRKKKGEFDVVFCYELDDENWRPTYILR
jgi:hypothetical protein